MWCLPRQVWSPSILFHAEFSLPEARFPFPERVVRRIYRPSTWRKPVPSVNKHYFFCIPYILYHLMQVACLRFFLKKSWKNHKKVEKSFGGVKKGRIFAVPFREGSFGPVPGTLGQVHWKDRKARKKQVPRKRESERRFIPGGASPGSYRDEAGPGSDKAK